MRRAITIDDKQLTQDHSFRTSDGFRVVVQFEHDRWADCGHAGTWSVLWEEYCPGLVTEGVEDPCELTVWKTPVYCDWGTYEGARIFSRKKALMLLSGREKRRISKRAAVQRIIKIDKAHDKQGMHVESQLDGFYVATAEVYHSGQLIVTRQLGGINPQTMAKLLRTFVCDTLDEARDFTTVLQNGAHL